MFLWNSLEMTWTICNTVCVIEIHTSVYKKKKKKRRQLSCHLDSSTYPCQRELLKRHNTYSIVYCHIYLGFTEIQIAEQWWQDNYSYKPACKYIKVYWPLALLDNLLLSHHLNLFRSQVFLPRITSISQCKTTQPFATMYIFFN